MLGVPVLPEGGPGGRGHPGREIIIAARQYLQATVHRTSKRVEVVAALEEQNKLSPTAVFGEPTGDGAHRGEAALRYPHVCQRIRLVWIESSRDEDHFGRKREGNGKEQIVEHRAVVGVRLPRRERAIHRETAANSRALLQRGAGPWIQGVLVNG